MAPMLTALTSQLVISNSHLLKTLLEALYSTSFLSSNCVKSNFDSFSKDLVGLFVRCLDEVLEPEVKRPEFV